MINLETSFLSLAKIQGMLFDNDTITILSPLLAGFVGGFAGIITFIHDFFDKPKKIICSVYCQLFAIYSGLVSMVSFLLLNKLDIKLLSISISEHPYLLALVIGFTGSALLFSSLQNSTNSDKETSKAMMLLFENCRKLLYSLYSRAQTTSLRPQVWEVVKNIPNECYWEFSLRCINTAKDINEEKGNALGETYHKNKENSINPASYNCEIGVAIAKIIGIDLLKQVAQEVQGLQPIISSDIRSLDIELKKLETIKP